MNRTERLIAQHEENLRLAKRMQASAVVATEERILARLRQQAN